MKKNNKSFAFLVHPRNRKDVFRKFPFLKLLPNKIVDIITRNLPPILVSKITGLKSTEGEDIDGYIITIPITAHQMMEDKEHAKKKILSALKYAEKKKVGIIGLGALTASFTRGGLDLIGKTNVGITTGRVYTVKTVTDYTKSIIERFSLPKDKIKIAIVGAGGSIGAGCAHILAEYGISNFLLVDLEKRAETVKENMNLIKGKNSNINISISHRIVDIKGYDIVIAATNAPEALIHADDLSSGAIIINDAQPSDVSDDVYDRDDILVIEGGVIKTPGINYHFNMGLANREDTFCCLGEVLILSRNNLFSNYATGYLSLDLINEMEKMAKNMEIGLSDIQNVEGIIPNKQIEKVGFILKKKYGI